MLLESAGRPDARASDDLEGAVGLTQILAETATGLLGMRVDVERSERLTRKLGRARGPRQADRIRAQRARVDERFDPEQGARGHRPLPEARQGRVRPRGPRGGLVPHGHRQPAAGARRLRRRRRRATRSSTSTPRPTAHRAPTASSPGSATTRRPTSGACSPPARSCACTATTSRELGRLARLHTAPRLGRARAAPARQTPTFESDDDVQAAMERGELRPVARGAPAGGVRAACLHPRRGAQRLRSHERAAHRGRATVRAGAGHPRDRLRLRRPPRLRERRPGGGVPVHARPPPGART